MTRSTCDRVRPQLTAYLDGDLADGDGSFVRGHLRECADCRQVARDEAALRDGLRTLAPVDPPASLWAGVQAQLAAAEVADARKPPWRRAIGQAIERWAHAVRFAPSLPQLAMAGMVAAVAVAGLTWRAHHAGPVTDEPAGSPVTTTERPAHPRVQPRAEPPVPGPPAMLAAPAGDVTADLAAEPVRTTAQYDQVVEELMKLADEARERWSDSDRVAFDARIAELRGAVVRAGAPRAAQRAERNLIRYLQTTMVRDEVVLASGGPR